MNPATMFYPCLALIFLTLIVLVIAFRGRVKAVRSGEISAAYFKTYDTGETLPRAARQADRCYQNLLESTPPFYFLCLASMALNQVDGLLVLMAWTYVAVRFAQSYVHVTANKIGPRSKLFMLSWLLLIAISFRLIFLLV